jgi:hypothetical protein
MGQGASPLANASNIKSKQAFGFINLIKTEMRKRIKLTSVLHYVLCLSEN